MGIEQHRIAAQGLKRVGMDEFGGAVAHGHRHFMARFFQQAHQLARFVSSDAARDGK